jgi:hypothetical protein
MVFSIKMWKQSIYWLSHLSIEWYSVGTFNRGCERGDGCDESNDESREREHIECSSAIGGE